MKYKRQALIIYMKFNPGAVLIDEDDFEKFKFLPVYKDPNGYIVAYVKNKQVYLHRLITEFKWNFVDHKNEIKHDCRKENLREATRYTNGHNVSAPIHNTSGHKGVSWWKPTKRWLARISVNGKRLYLGVYKEKEDAVAAYNKAAIKYFGDFAN